MSTEPNEKPLIEINGKQAFFWKLINLDDRRSNKALLIIGIIVVSIFANKMWDKSDQGYNTALQTSEKRAERAEAKLASVELELKAAYDTIHKLYRQEKGPLDKRIIQNDSIIDVKIKK